MSSSLHHSIFQYSKDIDCSEWLLIVVSRTDDIANLFSVRDFNCGQFTRGSRSRRPKSVQREQEEVAYSKLCRFISGQTFSKTRKLHRLGVVDKSVHGDPVILDVPLEDFWIDSFNRELWVVLTNRCTGSRHMRRPVYEK
ncbi:hypothetical protein JB92DRAFT_2834202 [Gautieria morchelliformis]|nr:hypothetical protein JB92DRAFT_2834202 [Gautieria morchelliformis]